MDLDSKLQNLLNEQINHEMSSSYVYLAMSSWFEETPYSGFAQWMYTQSLEETDHAMKFYRFLADRNAKVELMAIEQPSADYDSVLDVFKASLGQERRVTAQIHDLYSLADEVRDHETKNFLNWFLDEQVEEEKNVRDMIDRLELVGVNPVGLLQLDQEAAGRKPVAASGAV
ncbi:MAG: ferritin [Verrucomicrobiales bacterium]|nr:ferritin [Verrucomicrobiales bacterium]